MLPDLPHHAEELAVAVAAVREAGRLCRDVQQGMDPGVLEKKDRSPVTVADYGSQALVCRALAAAFPRDRVVGEEDAAALRDPANAGLLAQVTAHVRKLQPEADADAVCDWIDRGGADGTGDRYWTLDPIDGTKGFLRGQQYAVALALLEDGELQAAALCCPNLGASLAEGNGAGAVFAAVRGGGAWQLPMEYGTAAPIPVRVSDRDDPTQIRFCESVEAAHSSHDDAARLAARLRIAAEPARLDSQTKYAVVARGEAEAYLRLPRSAEYQEKIWDHAAGALVVTEAGGRVTDVFGKALDFGHGRLLAANRGVIVTNGRVHDAVLDAIAELGIGRF